MYNFEDIHLKFGEKASLFSFHFQKRKGKERIKYFQTLYHEYEFLERNLGNEVNYFGHPLPDGTYSISDRYCRYKIWRRKQRFKSLPNWLAILISLISLTFSAITLLWQLGYIKP